MTRRIELDDRLWATVLGSVENESYRVTRDARFNGLSDAEAARVPVATLLHAAAALAPRTMTADELADMARRLRGAHVMMRSTIAGHGHGEIAKVCDLSMTIAKLSMLARQRRLRPCSPDVVAEREAKRAEQTPAERRRRAAGE